MKTVRAILIVLALASGGASACGVCIEDTIAVVYDHDVVKRALANRHVVVFAVVAPASKASASLDDVRRATTGTRGVDRGSVRSAIEPAALSFALDPAVQAPQDALRAIEKQAAKQHLKLTLLRVVR